MNQRVDIATLAIEARPFKVYTQRQLDKIEALKDLPEALLFDMQVVSQVLPFRVNDYVIEELIEIGRAHV